MQLGTGVQDLSAQGCGKPQESVRQARAVSSVGRGKAQDRRQEISVCRVRRRDRLRGNLCITRVNRTNI